MLETWATTAADGQEIVAYELGGNGETLLIAHATGFCGPMYQQFADELTSRFRVVAFDFRGHGRSTLAAAEPVRPADLSWDAVALDALAVAKQLGDGPIHGFGHSMGGATLLLAEASCPGLFRSLFLYEPVVFPHDFPTSDQNVMAQMARRRRSTFTSRPEVLARFASRPPFNQMRAGFVSAYVEHGFRDDPDGTEGSVRLCCEPAHEAIIFEAGRDLGFDRVATVATPTVIAIGHQIEDGPNPARLGPSIAAGLAHGRLIRYPQFDHFGPFQDPFTVANDLASHAATI
jgi:pimeloyl-ACP methyl ester carboxylesterase